MDMPMNVEHALSLLQGHFKRETKCCDDLSFLLKRCLLKPMPDALGIGFKVSNIIV